MNKEEYLMCEHNSTFRLLMLAAGMMGAYTFVMRGGVFCNAQTANFVMMSVAFGQGAWQRGLYYLIPITAYLMGAVISEALPKPLNHIGLFRWDTYLVAFEIIVLFVLGWLPLTVPDQIVQVAINFIASMQYNTFRQSEGTPMATTFCTNHLRQTGIALVKALKKHNEAADAKIIKHALMLTFFFLGGVLVSIACKYINEKAIWLAMVPMLICFARMANADLNKERSVLSQKPHGH